MKQFLKTSALCGAALLSSASFSDAASLKGSRPNVIFVLTDDQGSNLSYMGHPTLQTPHIDAMAKESLRFTDYHVSPTCAPTRSAIMSGRHEFKNGVTHTVQEREIMSLSTTTFPQLLQKAGYKTGIFGKWHLGDEEAYLPENRGFDETLTHGGGGIGQLYPGSCADFPPNRAQKNKGFDLALLHNGEVVQTRGFCTDILFRAALSWAKEQHENDQPFFAYVTLNAPHTPLNAPKENFERILKRNPGMKKANPRYAMIENIDDNFGLMMQKLDEWKMLDDTLVIFSTDNGAAMNDWSDKSIPLEFNAGYKSGKGSSGEGGSHVPCFWYWKNKLPATDVKALTAHIDLYKTFVDLAGASIPDGIQKIDGRSLLPLLENPTAKWADRQLFIHNGRWKTGEAAERRDVNRAVRTTRWRMVGKNLYDISADPFEDKNVAGKYPEVMAELQQACNGWWDECLPLMVNENRKYAGKEPPFVEKYNKQKAERGIPEWNPPEI